MNRWIVVLMVVSAILIAALVPVQSLFTDVATSKGNSISSGEFSIGIGKDGSKFYHDLKLFDFSDLKPGDTRTVKFYIKNRGDIEVSHLSIILNVEDEEDGKMSPSEAAVDKTPDVGELSKNLIVESISLSLNGKVVEVEGVRGRTLNSLSGKQISFSLPESIKPGERAEVRMVFLLPKSAGNECQTDSVLVNMTVNAEQ